MKIFLITIIFNSFLIGQALGSCSIEFYELIVFSGIKTDLKSSDLIKKSNCKQNITNEFYQMAVNGSGTLRSRYLQEINPKVNISPKYFKIISLSDFLTKQLPPNMEIFGARFMNKKSISLKKEEEIDLSNNLKPGKRVFPIRTSGNTYWVEGAFKVKIQVLRSIEHLTPGNSELGPQYFETIYKSVLNPDLYFNDSLHLPYYKLNKSIRKNQLLKKSFLMKKNLVTFGIPASITYKKGHLILKGMGIPSQSGKFNDYVKLKNPKNRKIIYGKVNGINSVLVGI